MNTESCPETGIDQTDYFHTLLEVFDRLVLKVVKQTTELEKQSRSR